MRIEVSEKNFSQKEILTCAILALSGDVEVKRGTSCGISPEKAWEEMSVNYTPYIGKEIQKFIKEFSCKELEAFDPRIDKGDAQYMVAIDVVTTILQHKILQLRNTENTLQDIKIDRLGNTLLIVKTKHELEYLDKYPDSVDFKVLPTKNGYSVFDKENKVIKKVHTLKEVME